MKDLRTPCSWNLEAASGLGGEAAGTALTGVATSGAWAVAPASDLHGRRSTNSAIQSATSAVNSAGMEGIDDVEDRCDEKYDGSAALERQYEDCF